MKRTAERKTPARALSSGILDGKFRRDQGMFLLFFSVARWRHHLLRHEFRMPLIKGYNLSYVWCAAPLSADQDRSHVKRIDRTSCAKQKNRCRFRGGKAYHVSVGAIEVQERLYSTV